MRILRSTLVALTCAFSAVGGCKDSSENETGETEPDDNTKNPTECRNVGALTSTCDERAKKQSSSFVSCMEYLQGVDPEFQSPRNTLYRCDAADVRSGAVCNLDGAVAMCVVSIDIDGVVTPIGVKYLYLNANEPPTDESTVADLAEVDCVYLQPHNTFCPVAERSGPNGGNSTGGSSATGGAGGSPVMAGGGEGVGRGGSNESTGVGGKAERGGTGGSADEPGGESGAGGVPGGAGGSTVAPEPTCEKERCVDEFVSFRASEAASALGVDDTALYWIQDSEGLMKMPLGGGAREKLADVRPRVGGATSEFPNQITVFEGAIYWVEAFNYNSTGAVMSVATSGGVAEPLVEPWCPHGLSIWDGTVYVATESCYDSETDTRIDGALSSMPASGGDLEPLISLVDHSMAGPFAADASGIYFRTFDGLFRTPLEGGEPTSIAPGTSPGWALKDGIVYATIGRELVAIAADSGQSPPLATASPTSVAVAEDAVYWTGSDNAIHKVSLDGGETETLATDQLHPTHLTVHGNVLYWIVQGKETDRFNGGAIMRLYPR